MQQYNWMPAIWLLVLVVGRVSQAVEISSIKVPPAVENATGPVVLDCDYSVSPTERSGLVVQWFFGDHTSPVYQWIPGKKPQDLGILRGRLNVDYRASDDPYKRHRALEIIRPTTELSGEYRCKVATFEDEAVATSKMVVYVPATNLAISHHKPSSEAVNVTCKAEGVFPEPKIELTQESGPERQRVTLVGTDLQKAWRNGRYDVMLTKTLNDKSLEGQVVFECTLSIPGTQYQISRKTLYYPGLTTSTASPGQQSWESAPSVSAPHRGSRPASSDAPDADDDESDSMEKDDSAQGQSRETRDKTAQVFSGNGASGLMGGMMVILAVIPVFLARSRHC